MDRRTFLTAMSASGAAMLAGVGARAEWAPRRPLNIIVPYNAGGGTDAYARAIAATATDWPVPVVVVNKPGGGGITGAVEAASARPDGNTILLHFSGDFLLRHMAGRTDISPFESFDAIAQIGDVKVCIAVPAASPFNSLGDLVDAASRNPGNLRWSHNGRGATYHVAGQTFLNDQGATATDVPFQGGAPSRAAIIGGQVDYGCLGIQQSVGFQDDMRVLGLLGDERDPLYPDVPTFKEQGFDTPILSSPMILYAPLGTPRDTVEGIEAALGALAAREAFRQSLNERGLSVVYRTGADAIAALRKMQDAAGPVVAALANQ